MIDSFWVGGRDSAGEPHRGTFHLLGICACSLHHSACCHSRREVMKCGYRTARRSLVLSAFIFASASWPALAETPGEIPKPWTYEGSMKLQEQQRQQDQQFQQQPQSQQSGGAMAQGGAQSAAWDAARRNWQKKPPLPADRNPLLGKWTRPASTRGDPNDPFAQLKALAKGGMCEVLFGSGGVFEFRPDRLVGMDARTPEEELDRVEYQPVDVKGVDTSVTLDKRNAMPVE
jgi:hypothetical protein